MTTSDLQRCCCDWQAVLSLRDWRVTVVPPDLYALGKEGRSAQVDWDLCEKAATLSVLPADHPAVVGEPAPYDEEEAVVHELIHLLLAGQPRPTSDAESTLLEQAINALARALVRLRRAPLKEAPPWPS